jgi:hypothetical protein
MGSGKTQLEKPVLDRRERYSPEHQSLLCQHGRVHLQHATQLLNGLILEELPGREVQASLPATRHHLQAQDRIAPQFKEVVAQTDLRVRQHFSPQIG